MQQRLETIDKAQANIEKLSGDVLSLQDILSNKQTRGAFGEIQLTDIVGKALPPDSFTLQATLSNGKRADCLIHLPNPPGPIVIDAKFPLEAYEALRRAETRRRLTEARRRCCGPRSGRISAAISEKYILEGETADGAIMFLPSEAVYAELHAQLPRTGPRGLRGAGLDRLADHLHGDADHDAGDPQGRPDEEQAGAIRATLRQLHRDVELVVERVDKLTRHFTQARGDLDGITTAAERAGKRAGRLDNFDFEEIAPDPATLALEPAAR